MRSTEINWGELRAAAVVIGVREAGRQASAHLPPVEQERFVQRVMKRSQREGWIKQAQALTIQKTQAKPLSANVRNGSDALRSTLEEDSKASKLGYSKAGRKVAEKLGRMDEDELILPETAQSAKQWYGISAGLHTWEKETEGSGVFPKLAVYSQQTVLNVQVNEAPTPQGQE